MEGGPWNLKGTPRWLKPYCKEVVGAEGEAIFKGIPKRLRDRVVKESGAAEFVRKGPAKSLNSVEGNLAKSTEATGDQEEAA